MIKRVSLLCFLLTVAATAATTTAAQTRQAAGGASAGSDNRMEGSITIEGKSYKPAYVYGKLSDGPNDKTRPAVTLIFSEKPLVRKDVDDSKRLHSTMLEMKSKADSMVILELNIEGGKLYGCRVYSNGETLFPRGFPEENFDFKPTAWTPGLARASAATKGVRDFWGKKGQFNLSFNVALRKDEWTGTFFTPPPINLGAGRASGKITVNGKALKVNHVYAIKDVDMFDDKQTSTILRFTEKPLPENLMEAAATRRLKQTGNNHQLEFTLDDQPAAAGTISMRTFDLLRLDEQTRSALMFDYETDIIRADGQRIEGRLYTLKPAEIGKETYELDLAFNAAIKENPNAPITASNGTALPAGGGTPGKAYLDHMNALRQAKTLEEVVAVTNAMGAADDDDSINELKKLIETNPKLDTPAKKQEAQQALMELLRGPAAMDGMKITNGFVAGDRATLWITGRQEGQALEGRINMRLEQGQWKISKAALREAKTTPPPRQPVRKAPRKKP
jgi:hypothetical protein